MIPIDKLKAVRTVVSHENCPDGLAAAMIVKDVLVDARVVFCQYDTPAHREMPAESGMLFVDFSPHRSRAAEFVAAGAIVLDHHDTQADVVAAFGELGVYADNKGKDPGISGARLAYREVWRPLRLACTREALLASPAAPAWMPGERDVAELALLAGIRDTWRTTDPRFAEACAQAAALKFWPAERLIAQAPERWTEAMAIGPVLLEKQAAEVRKAAEHLYRFTSAGGLRVGVTQGVEITSDLAEALKDEIDLLMGFYYKVEKGLAKVVWSCRTRGAFQAKDIAIFYGGGGHDHAAGFAVAVEFDAHHPFVTATALVAMFEASRR